MSDVRILPPTFDAVVVEPHSMSTMDHIALVQNHDVHNQHHLRANHNSVYIVFFLLAPKVYPFFATYNHTIFFLAPAF